MESRLRSPSQKAEYRSVNAPWTYFFSPAGPDRSVVSSNPATAEAVVRARVSPTPSAARDAAPARHRGMNPPDTAGPAPSGVSSPHPSPGTAVKTTRETPRAPPPLPPRPPPPGGATGAGGHGGFPAVRRPRPPPPPRLLPQASAPRLQHRNPPRLPSDLLRLRRKPCRLLPDQRITRILRRRHISHSPESSPKPRSAATATPHTPPNRNQRPPTATPSPGA